MYTIQKNITRFYNLGYSYFLDPKELKSFTSQVKKKDYSILYPYPDSEKNIVYRGLEPDIFLYEIICNSPLRHQDILGAMYSLNISSDLFGDIVIIKNHYYIYILPIVQNYFESNFLKVKNSSVFLKQIPCSTLENYHREYEKLELICSSCRVDTVLSTILHTSRSSIKEYIQRKDILLNYDYLKEMDYKLKDGDVFSIRKIGKYQFHGVLRMTKANHYVIELYRYL